VDVRIIAATNRNLDEEVAAGRFRMDLYYRLNVFPIAIPPLRERREDILLLANFFINKFSLLENKIITGFSAEVIQAMENYDWRGNVRELENLMHRTALLTNSQIVSSFYIQGSKSNEISSETSLKSIPEIEREHIIATLKSCNWKVYGPGGAAELLRIHVSTLNSKIKKFGIDKIKMTTKST
jgi:transcriptional regulator with GAF, ATPase, and Fis domain